MCNYKVLYYTEEGGISTSKFLFLNYGK